MEDIFTRTKALLGEEKFSKIGSMTFAVVGLGGVGSILFEGLVRLGAKRIFIMDFDVVQASNLNRQLLYYYEDIGLNKVDVAKKRALAINKECEINCFNGALNNETINWFKENKVDFIFDAIDDINAKLALYEFCLNENINFISSLGMGNRLDSTKTVYTTLDKTSGDPLAKKIRTMCRKNNLNLKKINVVYSLEERRQMENISYVTSVVTTPSSAGLAMLSYLLNRIDLLVSNIDNNDKK